MKKILAGMLFFALFVGIATNAFAFSLPTTSVITAEETGITYKIAAHDTLSGVREVVMTSDENKNKTVLDYTPGEELTVTGYEYQGSQFFGLIPKYDISQETYDLTEPVGFIDDTEDEASLRKAVSYDSWVNDSFFKKYSYAWGNDDTTTYLKVKKKNVTYRVNYTSAKTAGKDACDNYTEAIRACNKYSKLGSFATAGGGVLAVIVVSVLAFADPEGITKLGLALLAALLTAMTGRTTAAVKEWINYYEAYLVVAETYKKVIPYGTKL